MQYLREVSGSIRYLDQQVKELSDKIFAIDTIIDQLDELPIQELLYRIDDLEAKTTKIGGFERGDSSTRSASLIEERRWIRSLPKGNVSYDY